MGEKLIHHQSQEHHKPYGEHSANSEQAAKHAVEQGKHAQHEHQKSIESIKRSIEQQAVSGKEYMGGERHHNPSGASSIGLNKAIKKAAYQKTLKNTRRQLSAPERGLSRIIHQPIVDTVSNAAGKTVARPSGILIGGAGALIGSVFLYFMGRKYGFAYNFLVYSLLFVVCYLMGIAGEYIFRLINKVR